MPGTWQEGVAIHVLNLSFVSPTEEKMPTYFHTHSPDSGTQRGSTFFTV